MSSWCTDFLKKRFGESVSTQMLASLTNLCVMCKFVSSEIFIFLHTHKCSHDVFKMKAFSQNTYKIWPTYFVENNSRCVPRMKYVYIEIDRIFSVIAQWRRLLFKSFCCKMHLTCQQRASRYQNKNTTASHT